MKKKILPLFLALCMAVSLSTAVWAAFPDVDENAEYAAAVEYVSSAGIMTGKLGGVFDPAGIVTRGEMAAIICRMRHEDNLDNGTEIFPDVPAGNWANGYVSRTAKLGIVKGYDTGYFGLTDTVTYEQAVTMIVRTKGWENEAISQGGWPYGYLATAKEHGLLSGVSSSVGAPFTRAEVARVVYNAQTEAVPQKESPKDVDLFQELKGKKFTLSDGGDWRTELTFGDNGKFTGTYRDPEPEDAEEEFSRGTVYMCDFSGQFSNAEKVDDWTYEIQLSSIKYENEPGEGWIDSGMRYVCTYPSGMEFVGAAYIYLPGCPTADVPEDLLFWIGAPNGWGKTPATLPCWGLYNAADGYGFYAKA